MTCFLIQDPMGLKINHGKFQNATTSAVIIRFLPRNFKRALVTMPNTGRHFSCQIGHNMALWNFDMRVYGNIWNLISGNRLIVDRVRMDKTFRIFLRSSRTMGLLFPVTICPSTTVEHLYKIFIWSFKKICCDIYRWDSPNMTALPWQPYHDGANQAHGNPTCRIGIPNTRTLHSKQKY